MDLKQHLGSSKPQTRKTVVFPIFATKQIHFDMLETQYFKCILQKIEGTQIKLLMSFVGN